MNVYLDTSAALRVLLRQAEPLLVWGKWEAAYSSELLGLEARRAIDRLRLEVALDDEAVAQFHQELSTLEKCLWRIPLARPVVERASLPMATSVKTLDAIHLATAMILQERLRQRLLFATHDRQQATAATALGFECVGV